MNEETVKALAKNVEELLANHTKQARLYSELLNECIWLLEGKITPDKKAALIQCLKTVTQGETK